MQEGGTGTTTAPEDLSQCLVMDDFGTITCPDNPELPANLQPYTPSVIGGAIRDGTAPIRNLPGQIAGGVGGALDKLAQFLKGLGTWVVVVLVLLVVLSLRR